MKKKYEGDEEATISSMLLILARTWIYMSIGALALFFIVKAIESRREPLEIYVYRSPAYTRREPEPIVIPKKEEAKHE